jgi:hypothetical protein
MNRCVLDRLLHELRVTSYKKKKKNGSGYKIKKGLKKVYDYMHLILLK